MKKCVVIVCVLSLMFQSASVLGQASTSLETNKGQSSNSQEVDMGQSLTPSKDASISSKGELRYSPISIDFTTIDSQKTSTTNSDVIVQSLITNDVHTTSAVVVTSELFKQSDDKYYIDRVSKSQDPLFTGAITYQKSTHVKEILRNVSPGQYRLGYTARTDKQVSWKSYESQRRQYGAGQELLFTVLPDGGVKKGWVDTSIPSQFTLTADSSLPAFDSSVGGSCHTPHRDELRIADQVTLTGTWQFNHRDSKLKGINRALIDVYYYDVCRKASDKWILIARTNLDEKGNFTASYPRITVPAPKWKVQLTLENNFARVQYPMPENEGQVSLSCLLMNCIALGQKTKSSAHTQSVEYGDLSNGGKLDPVVIPEKSFSERAAWLFDDAMKMYDFLSRYNNNLKKANIEYDPWHTTQSDVSSPELTVSHFNIFENVVKIIDTDTLSPNVTLHELGHLYMYEDYANRLPKSDCFSGRHIMYGTTEPGCAWNEGWAHFLSLVVNNSSIFDYGPSLGSVTYDIEDTTLFEGNGDAVEGRVAGALWDLYDKADDGLDTRDYAFSDIYSVIKTSVSEGNMIKNFADFWDKWKSLKFDKSAKYSIHQNQIVYLSPGEPELIEGQENQMIKITDISNATYNIVTSRYRDNRPLEINIYADFELKKLIKGATGVYSNPFPSLKDLELKEGQVYYLVVSDAIYLNSAVSAEVHLSLSRSPRAYPTLSPEVPAAINNQKEQVYVIEGDDQTGSIETSCYTTPNRQTTCFDTVLELYSDASLETLVASDDNAEPGNQARISGFTFKKGQTYYVRVRNSQVVQSISATVTFTTNTNYPTLKGNVPELFANKVKMVYKLEGYDGIPIIETSDYTSTDVQSKNSPIHSDTFLELYSDPYLKTRIAFDDNSAGNKLSRISSVKFEPGKTYYLKVRHPYPSVPITTAIMYRPIMTLAHKKVQILNGETERICRIQGANSRVSIKTGPFGHLSDTYLELYSDANLTRRIASDDNSLGGGYAGIDWRLDEGNTVYLKVKSGKDKNRTGPAVTPVYAWIYMEYLPHG